MTYIGDFSAAVQDAEKDPNDPDSFGWCGETFHLRGAVTAMTVMQFAAIAVKGVAVDELAAAAAILRFLEDVVAPEDWEEFQEVSRRADCSMDDYMALVQAAIQAAAARPTSRPSASPDGPSSDGASSKDDSSSLEPGDPRLDLVPVGRAAKALR